MALMTEERRKEMEQEMNRFELEIAGPEEESPVLIQRPRPMTPPPTIPNIAALIPEVLSKPPPPPPPPLSPPPMPNRIRFIPPQLHRHPRPHFMEPMMHPHHHFPPCGPMGHFPMVRQMMPRAPMHPMGASLPVPPGFCPPNLHPPPPPPLSYEVTSEPETPPASTNAPTIYAAPFVKSGIETFITEKSEKVKVSEPSVHVNVDEPVVVAPPVSKKKEKKKKIVRMAGGQAWEDNSLLDWESDDFRIFCGDLGNDVTDEVLIRAFSKYPSFVKAKVIRDKRTNKTKGFGFVSFKDPQDFIKAMREMNGRYVGSRPIKLRKSTWRDRNIDIVKKKQKEKEKLGLL